MNEIDDYQRGAAMATAQILRIRGVNSPCDTCAGYGWRQYSHGSTWRGGMGTAAFCADVCDQCWGSGDANRQGMNLRLMEAKRKAWDADQCYQWLASQLGGSLSLIRPRLGQLAELCEKQERRRKLPDGETDWAWQSSWHALSEILRRLARS